MCYCLEFCGFLYGVVVDCYLCCFWVGVCSGYEMGVLCIAFDVDDD